MKYKKITFLTERAWFIVVGWFPQ